MKPHLRSGPAKISYVPDEDAKANDGLIAAGDELGMHGPTPVLDDNGKPREAKLTPQDKKVLSEEIAVPELAGYRSLWDQSIARGLTPEKLAAILQASKRGDHRPYLELAEEMEERDLHYLAVLSTRKRQLARLKPSIDEDHAKARGVDKKVIEAVKELVEAPEFRLLLEGMTDSFGKGYAAVEIMWTSVDGRWKPAAYLWRDPKYFTFDYVSRSELRLAELTTLDGLALPPAKFVVHMPAIKAGVPIRAGFAWLAAWAWLFKQYTLKDWVSFLDIYGMPLRLGKYHPSATPDERRKLLQAVSRIAVDAAAIIPESMAIEFLEAKGNSDKPFEALGSYLDKQISKAILGQTMTTDGHAGGLAQAKIHNEVRIDILEDDAEKLEFTLDRDLISWFVKLNFGDQAPRPRVKFPVAEPQDIAVKSTAIAQLIPMGLKVSQAAVRDIVGLPAPEDGEEILTPPAAATPEEPAPDPTTRSDVRAAATNSFMHRPAGGICPCGCGRRISYNAEGVSAPSDPDVIDRIGEDEADDWEAQLGPIVAPILKAAAESASFEEFLAKLDALTNSLDLDPLTGRLAIAAMKARGFGRGAGPDGRLGAEA
ncbi:DUF935 domain-containing protein [Rhodoblastus sp.]|uniref:DUF935 domain-containing protein n=1 Tax=Rhodoblastus sp. TaxID=1962975 RepID=UPI003F974022